MSATLKPLRIGDEHVDPAAPRIVFYSLYSDPLNPGSAAGATRQLVRSVGSLRAHNREIPVRIFVFGALDERAREELLTYAVTFIDVGDYETQLARSCAPAAAEALSKSLHLHALLCLPLLADPPSTRVLYLDGDTFFFGDVSAIFDRYRDLDVYAREEPWSRASPFGCDPAAIDEDKLAALAARCDVVPVRPFNKGVLLFNHGSWLTIAETTGLLLRLAFRIGVGLALQPGWMDRWEIAHLRANRARMITEGDAREALDYPSANVWIRDQVAIWLAWGSIPALRFGFLSRHHVMQGGEAARLRVVTQTVAHYFGKNVDEFEAWLDSHRAERERAGLRGLVAPGSLVEGLGRQITEAWRAVDYDASGFAAIAAAALREAGLKGRETILPGGEREFRVLYDGERLSIDMLSGGPVRGGIHRNACSGAAVVVEGSVLRCRYAFEVRRKVNPRFLLGRLVLVGFEHRAPGEIFELTADGIESFHLVGADAAVVFVRATREAEDGPRYEYRYPTVAVERDRLAATTEENVRRLCALWASAPSEARQETAAFVASADLETCWHLFSEVGRRAPAAPLGELLGMASAVHSVNVDELAAALREDARARLASACEERAPHADHRLFLSLLRDVPVRAPIEALLRAHHPESDPQERILEWIEALAGTEELGLDATDDLNRRILEGLLRGRSNTEIVGELATTFDAGEVARQVDVLLEHCDDVRATVFAPLFR